MPSTPVEIVLPSGLTATLSLYAVGSDTLANSDGADVLVEDSNARGFYTATVTEALSGVHKVKVLVGSSVVANGYVDMVDDVNRRYVVDSYPSAASVSGAGARTITITVDDGSSPLEGATVRFGEGANTYTATTDVSGNATFNLDDATYTVAITKPGYTFSGTTLVVSADATPTYSMTALSPTASPAGFSTGYLYVYDELGVVESGAVITIIAAEPPSGSGVAMDSRPRTGTTNGSGYVEFTNLIQGAKYTIRRGGGRAYDFTCPAEATFLLTNILGAEL